jgi:pimeloyl-ACP methyl ester carboxylesterase
MRRARVQFAAAVLVGLLAGSLAAPVARADDASRWERATHAVIGLWRSDAGRDAKALVRERFVRSADLDHYGLTFDPGWERRAAEKPLVVLLHGYNSTPQRNGALLRPLRNAGYSCAQFAFPNDHELADSAELLADELAELAHEHPDRRVALLTHSMGGLVARECIENPVLDPGNVDRLIMIAPPNQGTMVAHLAVCADVWEHGLFRRGDGCITRLKDSIVDGLAEAADDLRPGSVFLTKLNKRPRNPNVEYSIFLGTGGKLREREVDAVRGAMRKTVGKVPGLRTTVRKLDRRLGRMDEVIDGKGDGVVAIERALLPGVNDVVVLPFGHLSVTGPPRSRVVREVHREVLERLQ